MSTVTYVYTPLVIFALALLSGCSAVEVGPACEISVNPYCMSLLAVGDGANDPSYNLTEATRIADHMLDHMVPHYADRTSQEGAERASREAIYYTSAYIFPDNGTLPVACNVKVPENHKLYGCTKTETGDILLLEQGRLCETALMHEINHKWLKSLTGEWDYDHKDESWMQVDKLEDTVCDGV